ncbi:MAG: efflux transporter outer membrane subunit [Acidobacteria bacterium]|nr:efflux transporter outer membrane subunit [Acidobacteriota bacterium]
MRGALAAALVAALALTGCHVQQSYKPPSAPTPAAYQEAPPASFQESKQWRAANPADGLARGRWWEIFRDPTLNSLEEKAFAANENVKAAVARFDEARAFVRENRSGRLPTVAVAPGIVNERFSKNRPLAPQGKAVFGDFTLPFSASWEPDFWGRIRTQIDSAATGAQAVAADVESVRLGVTAELAFDYFDLRGYDRERGILESAVKTYERALELTRNRFAGGVANRVDVEESETQLEATRAQAIDITAQRAKLEHAIAVLTGQTPEGFSLPEQAGVPEPPAIPIGVPSALLERRPDIAGLERRVASANARIGLARAAFYPRVMLAAALGLEGTSITNWLNWPSRFWAIGPSALQTIYDGGRRRAVLDEATAGYDSLLASYRETVLTAFQQVEDSVSSLRILESEAERQRAAVEAARRSEALSMNRYRGGLVTYLEVATAQAIRLQNERVAVGLERRRMESSVALIKALGGGWDAHSLPTEKDLAGQ